MKNLKNFAFGLLVAILAVGFSAFTAQQNKRVADWVYVQTSNDVYEKIPFSNYDADCITGSNQPCAFIQDELDTDDHGSPLSRETLEGIESMESNGTGLYNPL